MEKVLGGAEGIVAVLVQQSDGESAVFFLSPASLTKGGLKIIAEQLILMGKLIFYFWALNRGNKQDLETVSGPVDMQGMLLYFTEEKPFCLTNLWLERGVQIQIHTLTKGGFQGLLTLLFHAGVSSSFQD